MCTLICQFRAKIVYAYVVLLLFPPPYLLSVEFRNTNDDHEYIPSSNIEVS